mmetsp:Transcript_27471/g.50713  ORF Transcript_27471/g.50713 Transcript_27471/m.50713 type:complete len:202 (+) Transcript_27471:3211-3816(+)
MICHTRHRRRENRHLPIVAPRQQRREIRVQRLITRNYADRIVDARQAARQTVRPRSQLPARRPIQPSKHLKIAQRIHNFAASVGRAQHHHPAQFLWTRMVGEPIAHHDTAHGMGDKMRRLRPAGGHCIGDHIRRQGLHRLRGRGVTRTHDAVAFGDQRLLHQQERRFGARKPVQQDHTIRPRHADHRQQTNTNCQSLSHIA